MDTLSPKLSRDYSRVERATIERMAMRNGVLPVYEQKRQEQARISEEERKQKQVRLWAYSGPLMVAGLKDALDLVMIGSFPGIGTVVTFCFYSLIFFMFLIQDGLTVRMKPTFLFQAGGALIFATGTEGLIFGLNFLPVGLGIILGIYFREKQYARSMKTLKKI
ncbi:MAG: hypothetical protein KA054_00960 [Candidatus Moranbacteria bacterium]|nr:hypothetical protein [Candidatus Moranbacteria bacterium]